ncbi:hypothetical protein ACFSM5_21180 [Lacibacterium aquatile]|uniref:Uncharacterized protein n=1 Tax=Lacibacterium aquatile TaxID=1168082 RepID=A0ABW5DWR5_9PROT
MRFLRLVLNDPNSPPHYPITGIAVLNADINRPVPGVVDFKVLYGAELTDSFEVMWDHCTEPTMLSHDYSTAESIARLRLRWLGLSGRSANPRAVFLGDRLPSFGVSISSLYELAALIGLPVEPAFSNDGPNSREKLLRCLLTSAALELLLMKNGRERMSAFLIDLCAGNGLEGPDQDIGRAFADQAIEQIRFIRWQPPQDCREIEF